jgi:tetratricopeptide (TPR) repeat protein
MAMTPAEWTKRVSSSVALREQPDTSILYEDESHYCHIAVKQAPDNPNRRFFCLDKLNHSEILMGNILDLQSPYTKIYAAVTEVLSRNKEKLCVMVIGGGGYVYPQYVEKVWPGSRIDVVEIDPGVTEAAIRAFGLERNTTINTINADARNYVDKLLEQKRNGQEIPRYDFIYEDAINNFSVPFQLVTREFNEKIFTLLRDDGVYMVNIVDIFDSGLFLGSVAKTLEKTFPYVYVVTEDVDRSIRNTFVIIAAKYKLDLKNIISQSEKGRELKLWYPDISDTGNLGQKSRHLVLTDNYCPVENLLTPVVCRSSKEIADIFHNRAEENIKRASAQKYFERAKELQQKGLFAESIENYLSAIEANPTVSIQSYNEIGIMYARTGNPKQAVEAFNKAVQYNNESEHKINMAITCRNLGIVLKKTGESEQAMEQFRKAVEESRRELAENPTYPQSWKRLGDTLVLMKDFKAAAEAFKEALALNPNEPVYYDNLVKALEYQGRYAEAIEVLKKYIQLMKHNKQDKTITQLQTYLESREYKNSKSKQPD